MQVGPSRCRRRHNLLYCQQVIPFTQRSHVTRFYCVVTAENFPPPSGNEFPTFTDLPLHPLDTTTKGPINCLHSITQQSIGNLLAFLTFNSQYSFKDVNVLVHNDELTGLDYLFDTNRSLGRYLPTIRRFRFGH